VRYILSFGTANAGQVPTFTDFVNADTWAAVTPPTIVEAPSASGTYYFDYAWSDPTITSIWYIAECNGLQLDDTINATTVAAASGAGGTGAASVPWLWTAGNIINTVAIEVGLDQVADPYASTDKNFIQLRTLLRSVGHELWMAREWKALVKEASYTGDGTSTLFNLPVDFGRMVDGSGWRRTDQQPMGGPISSQDWQFLNAWTSSADLTILHRIVGNRIEFHTAIASTLVVYHDYTSRYWVASSGAASPDLYEPSTSSDTVMLEPVLVARLLKCKWLEAKGRDSTSARQEYQQAFEGAAGNEPAPTLNMAGPRARFRYLNWQNVPETGMG
jgi:hypothetical protein